MDLVSLGSTAALPPSNGRLWLGLFDLVPAVPWEMHAMRCAWAAVIAER